MRVVIAGAWHLVEDDYTSLVNDLITGLYQMYGDTLKVITGGCDRGIGKIVKARCLPADETGHRSKKAEYDFLEVNMKVYWERPSKAELAQIWVARNALWSELGEEFHIFTDRQGGGAMQDLIERVVAQGLPHSVYKPGIDKAPKLMAMR